MREVQMTRRQALKTAGGAAVLASSPWWMVAKSHAQRAKKLVFWHVPNFTPLADELQKQQVYEFAKQAGLKEDDVEYAIVANEQFNAKLAAAIEAGNPPDVTRLYESNVQFYAAERPPARRQRPRREDAPGAQGHLRVGHDLGRRTRGAPWACRWPSIRGRCTRAWICWSRPRSSIPKTWDEFVETSKKIQSPPRLFAFGMCLGLVEDTTDNVMNLLWCYGGKMVEADNKTVVMNSAENVAGVKMIEAMFKTHKIIPPGAISWDNSGNNKAYQSKQAAFVMNPSSIYAYLDGNDKDLQKVTGLFPVPAGPKGTVNQIDTWAYGAFKKNPYPDLAKGLLDYLMQPANYDKIIQSTGGRWVPVYKRLFDSPFWKEKPAFAHFIKMAETGVPVSYAGSPTPAAGEVLNTHVIPKMIQRVLVENWEAGQGARGVPQEDRGDLRPERQGLAPGVRFRFGEGRRQRPQRDARFRVRARGKDPARRSGAAGSSSRTSAGPAPAARARPVGRAGIRRRSGPRRPASVISRPRPSS